jgi:hypothetical protein
MTHKSTVTLLQVTLDSDPDVFFFILVAENLTMLKNLLSFRNDVG